MDQRCFMDEFNCRCGTLRGLIRMGISESNGVPGKQQTSSDPFARTQCRIGNFLFQCFAPGTHTSNLLIYSREGAGQPGSIVPGWRFRKPGGAEDDRC